MREARIQNTLASMLMLIICILILLLFWRETPPTNKELVSLALGVLLGSMKDVYNYYFGSTRAADRKDEIVQNALNAQSTSTPKQDITQP